ncbi:MAG: MBL fold metallo-hydrolase [Pyrinomonadaceae bacterium MAG19_C2-C3]|nr:MBL fold metallo-hydrolase [Pyrinomonadaceae bacterium MAG19_C2-C3]
MKIQLISHASVIIECSDARIWTDPWLVSKVFNDSWTMLPSPVFDSSLYDTIDYIWLSHEHPDHFNVPTLRQMPAEFKERVTILFQKKNTAKIFDAMRAWGFRNFRELPNRKIVDLTPQTKLYCFQVGVMDSILGVINEGQRLLNINDAKINEKDCAIIKRDFERTDVILNQFSLAGYNGFVDYEKHLPRYAKDDLDNLLANHRDLGAKVTIPFASYVYFSCSDNKYVNRFANKPQDVYDLLKDEAVILYPGETYEVGKPHDSTEALRHYAEEYSDMDKLAYSEPKRVELSEIEATFQKLAAELHERYPKTLLSFFKPVTAQIPDLQCAIEFSVAARSFKQISNGDEADLIVNSQPLQFAFKVPFGVQTLGVSARFLIRKNFKNWKYHRILFSLNNAELYLRPRYFFRPSNLKYIAERIPGGANQLVGRLARME